MSVNPHSIFRKSNDHTMLPIIQIGEVLLSPDIFTEYFACDLARCHGACCKEGEDGAPVTLDEIMDLEQAAEDLGDELSTEAQEVIDEQGVAYPDRDGEMVTSIIHGRDCVFAKDVLLGEGGQSVSPKTPALGDKTPALGVKKPFPCTICLIEQQQKCGKTAVEKPISCALYPIREKRFSNNLTGLNYHRWEICLSARERGLRESVRLYEFLKEPLIRRFGKAWYEELLSVAEELLKGGVSGLEK